MEFKSIEESLENKTILVTGSTGFLAKVFVEKVLRTQPNVKKLYLLVRAVNTKSAIERLHNEVFGKEVFRVLREINGSKFDSFISDKLIAVPGDVACEHLGVKDSNLREEMWREIDFIVNSAATTNFDERYDVSLGINCLGAKHVLDFAKKCIKLKTLLHVSTAYVAGEKEGLILEKPFRMGETLKGNSNLDIEEEIKVMKERLIQLRDEEATKEAETFAMKELGLTRARLNGWPNTYVFTKAMGEMLLGDFRENLPLVIIRPTIITSTFREPIPGWVEGIRTIDSLAVGYGKGKITCFLGDPDSIIDVVPADMVVNCVIVAMVANANKSSELIYHIGSSIRNPAKFTLFQAYGYHYFTKNPWIGKDGKPIKVGKVAVFNTMDSFHGYMTIRYLLPLKALQAMDIIFCKYFHGIYTDLNRKIKFVMRLVDLYKPYLFFKGVFDDLNTERLRMEQREKYKDADAFCFDPKSLDWDNYFLNTHIPGVVKYVFK